VLIVIAACNGGGASNSDGGNSDSSKGGAGTCAVDTSREPGPAAGKNGPTDAPVARGIVCELQHTDKLPATGKLPTKDMDLALYANATASSAWNFFRKHSSDFGVSFIEPDLMMAPTGKNVRTGCGTGEIKVAEMLKLKDSPFYCQDDHRYYTNPYWLKKLRTYGDIAPPLAAGHEFTHAVQAAEGFPPYAYASPAEVLYEDMADCGSGAYYASIMGQRSSAQRNADKAAIKKYFDYLMKLNTRRPYHDKAHGGNERLFAFNAGRNGGLKACNQFSPGKRKSGKPITLVD
jgi:predicted metalloprotease